MYIRAYVCVMDVANLYLGTCRYLMYLVSVRSRRLGTAEGGCILGTLGVRYVYICVHTSGRYICVGIWVFRYRYGYLDTGG